MGTQFIPRVDDVFIDTLKEEWVVIAIDYGANSYTMVNPDGDFNYWVLQDFNTACDVTRSRSTTEMVAAILEPGPCECGAAHTGNPEHHSDWCPA